MKVSTLAGFAGAILAAALAAARAEVLIATAAPMSGQYASMGEQHRRGAERSVADLNAAGGVLGQPVALTVGDDGCDAAQAVAVARNLVSRGVVFVAGHFCSGASIPASAVYHANSVLMISPSSTNPRLTEQGHANVFRVCGRDDQQGLVAGNYLADHWSAKRIAILHDGTAYGEGLAEETRKQLNRRGVVETLYESYAPGERDYSLLMSRLQAAGVDVFYVGGYSTEAALMLRQVRDAGSSMQLVSGDALVTDEFWQITGPAGEGALMTFFPDPRNNPAAAQTVAALRSQGYEPEGYTLYSYASVQAWAQAVERAGTFELEAVVDALRSGEFQTVLGPIRFNAKGDVITPSFIWYAWRDGRYVPNQ